MSDNTILQNCSPTLAGIKTGNLFSCAFEERQALLQELRVLNRRLAAKGLRLVVLRFYKGRALIYLYRPQALRRDLMEPQAARLLRECGYGDPDAADCLRELARRLRCRQEFPHEIGLFLGYPARDVEGFLRDGGRAPLYTGMWKVYGDVEGMKRLFDRYRRCTEVYCRLNREGRTLEQLAVTI